MLSEKSLEILGPTDNPWKRIPSNPTEAADINAEPKWTRLVSQPRKQTTTS